MLSMNARTNVAAIGPHVHRREGEEDAARAD